MSCPETWSKATLFVVKQAYSFYLLQIAANSAVIDQSA